MNRIVFILGVYFLCTINMFVIAQNSPARNAQEAINLFVRDSSLKHAGISFSAIDIDTKKSISLYQPDMSLAPASTLKLLTTATALEILGKNHIFHTLLEYDGDIMPSGHLKGNLYIRGKGDPSLGSKYFLESNNFTQECCNKLKKNGITAIDGQIIADKSYYKSDIPRTWIWEDIANYYGSAAHGLSYRDNTYTLFFESGPAGTPTKLKSITPDPKLTFDNRVISSELNRDEAYIFGGPESSSRTIEGSIPHNRKSFRVKGATPDPGFILASELKARLNAAGIEAYNPVDKNNTFRSADSKRKRLLTYNSPTLDKIVYYTNQKSINLFAEHLLKELGKQLKGEGNTANGVDAVKEYWQKRGLNTSAAFLHDGSGLSRFSALSSRFLTNILLQMHESNNYNVFYKSLPIAGKTGTLKYFARNTALQNNLRAKTGSMQGVRSYSGYMTTLKGKQVAFTLIINNYSCTPGKLTQKVEQLLIMIFNS